jgi:hypothetical protein
MSYLRYLCLFANSVFFVFVLCLVYLMLPVSQDCPFLIAHSVFSPFLIVHSVFSPFLIAHSVFSTFICTP